MFCIEQSLFFSIIIRIFSELCINSAARDTDCSPNRESDNSSGAEPANLRRPESAQSNRSESAHLRRQDSALSNRSELACLRRPDSAQSNCSEHARSRRSESEPSLGVTSFDSSEFWPFFSTRRGQQFTVQYL